MEFTSNVIYGTRVEMIDEMARLHADMIQLPAYKLHQIETKRPIWTKEFNKEVFKDKDTEEVRQTLLFMRDLYTTFSGTRKGAVYIPQERKRRI